MMPSAAPTTAHCQTALTVLLCTQLLESLRSGALTAKTLDLSAPELGITDSHVQCLAKSIHLYPIVAEVNLQGSSVGTKVCTEQLCKPLAWPPPTHDSTTGSPSPPTGGAGAGTGHAWRLPPVPQRRHLPAAYLPRHRRRLRRRLQQGTCV